MSHLRRLVARVLIVVLTIGFAGWTYGAEGFAAGLSHDLEAAMSAGAQSPVGSDDGDCKHKCQAHYGQHFKAQTPLRVAYVVASTSDAPRTPVIAGHPLDSLSTLYRPPCISSR